MDLISIVVAVYNAEQTLKKCVDSLLAQTYKNTEIILVNDCSTDNSLSVCKEYESKYENVIVVDNEKNSGVSFTRNQGIKASKGKYICFVDSDDYVEPDYLEVLYNCYQKYNTVPICGFVYHDEVDNRPPVNYVWSGGDELVSLGEAFRLYDELYLTALWNKLFSVRKIKENNLLFDIKLSMGEDLKFSVEYFQKTNTEKVYVFSDTLYHYTKLTNSSLMSKFARNGIDGGLESLQLIRDLAINFNPNADVIYNLEIERLKNNLIYFLIRDKSFSKKEKIEKIREFKPDFSKRDYRRNRLIFYKECVYKCLFGK